MISLLAQVQKDLGGKELRGIGPLGFEGKTGSDIFIFFPSIISTIIGILTASAVIWFVIQFMLGAFKWISSGGDAKQIEGARSQIMQAVFGLIIIFSALIFLSVLGGIFGLDVLDLREMLLKLGPQGAGFSGGGGGGNTGP